MNSDSTTDEQVDVTEDSKESGPTISVGKVLKNQREKSNMTQEEVASKMHLNVDYIIAIESDDYTKISGESYVNGYIRSYAKLLKLPEQEVVTLSKDAEHQQTNLVPNYMERKIAFTDDSMSAKTWVLLFVAITGLLFLTWWFIRQ